MSISVLIDKNELKIAQKLVNSSSIPSPPKLLMDIKTELTLAEPNNHKIIGWISEDIGLSAKIIKTINSPLYGLRTEIDSLDQAVKLLGIKKLKDIIINPAYRQALEQSFSGFEAISEAAHQVGSMAEIISREIETEQKGGVFYLAGLFHNVGSLVMAGKYPDYLASHEQNILNPISWPATEQSMYNIRHMAVGVLLAKHWGLANTVCNAIYLHHAIVSTYKKWIDIESTTMASVLSMAINLVDKNYLKLPVEQSAECILLYNSIQNELMLDDDTLLNIEQDAKSIY
jgi:HD-like signal output (HDOD) protein